MTTSRFVPPLEYLQAASRTSLQSFELARLNHAANLRREIAALMDQWIQETSEAMLARFMLDRHTSLQEAPLTASDTFSTFLTPASDPLPPAAAPPQEIVPAAPRFSRAMTQKSPKSRSTAG
jgi:hypothetical protein